MSEKDNSQHSQEKHLHAYDRMMERVRAAIQDFEKEAGPVLGHVIDIAKDKSVELGEVTREEAEKIGAYLKRDIEDAAEYLASPNAKELADWFKFDIDQIEDRLLEMFTSVADSTKVELMALEERARQGGEYHTGEITGIGTLECTQCGQQIHFKTTGHIPPCPHCHQTGFVRPLS
ncbi:MAG: zinc ribbon-containing protein [Gammaproteobacteria bacterium]